MNLIPLLVLPLVGGYGFSVTWKRAYYAARRESGYRLYFRSTIYGVYLVLLCIVLNISLLHFDFYHTILQIAQPSCKITPIATFGVESQIAVLVESFFVGPILGFFLNFPAWGILVNKKFIPEKVQNFSNQSHLKYVRKAILDNDFEKMMYLSFTKQMPVMFTLNSRKVYIGIVNFLPNPAHDRKSVSILPVYSGYRKDDTLKYVKTVDYTPIIRPYFPKKMKDKYLAKIKKEYEEKVKHFEKIENDFIERFKKDTSDENTQRFKILEEIAVTQKKKYKKELDEKKESLKKVRKHMSLDDFDIVIPINDVAYCHFFDTETYSDFVDHNGSSSDESTI